MDETELPNENPVDYVLRLAKSKAETIAGKMPNQLVLGADTTVVVDGQIIGKPLDLNDARRMLMLLSGKWHEVLTGVALVKIEAESHRKGENENFTNSTFGSKHLSAGLERTRVKFAEFNAAEIEFLVEFGEPLDKAGAYAVQAQAALFIEKIEGDYWNVVGLPVNLVYRLLSATK